MLGGAGIIPITRICTALSSLAALGGTTGPEIHWQILLQPPRKGVHVKHWGPSGLEERYSLSVRYHGVSPH